MAHGHSLNNKMNLLKQKQRQQLLDIAYDSIKSGLSNKKPVAIDLSKFDAALQTKRATFITLLKNGELRGCIGVLEPIRALVDDVANNAYAAAFSDHRFPPLADNELEQLEIQISILGIPEEIFFTSEEDLIRQLKPNIDGLIMESGNHRGTFLPSVWESLAQPQDFLNHLKIKSGLAKTYWDDNIKIHRYSVEKF